MKPLLLLLALFSQASADKAVNSQAATVEASGAQLAVTVETPTQRDTRMAWWREAKFGMFIHWGLYASPAKGEWVMNQKKIPVAEYAKLASQFTPVKFNAEKWVRFAKLPG